jgi:hypothetical protein
MVVELVTVVVTVLMLVVVLALRVEICAYSNNATESRKMVVTASMTTDQFLAVFADTNCYGRGSSLRAFFRSSIHLFSPTIPIPATSAGVLSSGAHICALLGCSQHFGRTFHFPEENKNIEETVHRLASDLAFGL